VTFFAAFDAALGEFSVRITARYRNRDLTCGILLVVKTSTGLVPNDFEASIGSPDVGQEIVLGAPVTNLGYGNPSNVKAELRWNGQSIANASNPIGPMQSVPFTFVWTPESGDFGENVFMIVIDPDRIVDEITRANNNATTRVCVGCGIYSFSVQSNGLKNLSAKVSVDGIEVGVVTDAKPWDANYPIREPHKITVDQCIYESESERLCTPSYSWNAPDTTGTKTVSYLPQYLVTITTSPSGSPEPVYSKPLECPVESHSCWYSPSTVPIVYVSWTVEQPIDKATRWYLRIITVESDSVQTSLLQYPFVMNRPHTLELHYMRQCYLNLTSDYSSVEGSGWYDEHSLASWKLHKSAVQVNSCEDSWWAVICLT
jgi:hypothetical protein